MSPATGRSPFRPSIVSTVALFLGASSCLQPLPPADRALDTAAGPGKSDGGGGGAGNDPDAARRDEDGGGGGPDSGRPADGGGPVPPIDGGLDVEAGQDAGVSPPLSCTFLFSEVMVNPQGEDAPGEFVELYNGSGEEQDLRGHVLVLQLAGQPQRWHQLESPAPLRVAPSAFFLLGPPDAQGVDYHWRGFGTLPNTWSAGLVTLELRLDGQLVDSFTYLDPSGEALGPPLDGASFQLHRDLVDRDGCLTNDPPAAWCPGAMPGPDGNLATPGQPNLACGEVGCFPEDEAGRPLPWRPVVRPRPWQLAIQEVFPNPACSPERDREWFELVNLAGYNVDLVDVRLFTRSDQEAARFTFGGPLRSCFELPPARRVVIAASADPARNGGIAAWASYDDAFTLTNSGGYLALRLPDGTLLDEVRWESSSQNRSLEADPNQICGSPQGNDEPRCWHASPRPQGEQCGVPSYHSAGELSDPHGTCYCADPAAPGGWQRLEPGLPVPMLLEVSEILPDVDGPEGEGWGREWIELRVLSPFSLNCAALRIGERRLELPWTACQPFAAGELVVLAASADPARNGGLPALQLLEAGRLDLPREGSLTVELVDRPSAALEYAAGEEGQPIQRDEAGRICASPAPGGTPGLPNPPCP